MYRDFHPELTASRCDLRMRLVATSKRLKEFKKFSALLHQRRMTDVIMDMKSTTFMWSYT